MSKLKKGSQKPGRESTPAPDGPAPAPENAATVAPDRRAWLVVLLPALAALVAYVPVLRNQFVEYWDDNLGLLQNPAFMGMDRARIRWALTTFHMGVYQPLAWLLFETQFVLFRLAPWGYHLVSLVFYVAEAVALYVLTVALLVRCRTVAVRHGSWPIHLGAGLAVALFVAHPLRDEVVAWVSGQPYLPCALFATLAVLAYLHAYPEDRPPRPAWAIAAVVLFVAAMMSKAVAVTLPVVLLILDVYPLRRIGRGNDGGVAGLFANRAARWAWVEKLGYLAVAAVFAVLNTRAREQTQIMAMGHLLDQGPLIERVAQACYAVVFYLAKTVWPFAITAVYVLPPQLDWTEPRFALSMLVVGGVTVTLLLLGRRRPGWVAAWLCYLVILAPNSGLKRIGTQIAADRYSYMAMFGLVVLAAAGLARLMTARNRAAAPACLVAGIALLAVLTVLSWRQCTYWYDSIALWRRAMNYAVIVDPSSHSHLGMALMKAGDVEGSLASFEQALIYKPDHIQAHAQMGRALIELHRYAEAAPHLAEALRQRPSNEDRFFLGVALAEQGKPAEAEAQFTTVLRSNSGNVRLHDQLGGVLAQQGKLTEAEAQFAAALRGSPDNAEIHNNLGAVLARQGKLTEAEAHFADAVRLQPSNILAQKNLGEALADRGALDEAQTQLADVVRREPGHLDARLLLGGVLLKQGKLNDAEAQFSEVLRANPANPTAQSALIEIAHRRERPLPP